MSLSSALSTAQSMLSNTATQTSIISKNVANAGNTNYSRRSASIATAVPGGAQVVGVQRAQDSALLHQLLASTSSSNGQSVVLEGLDKLQATMGGSDYAQAPATLAADFRDALQLYATQPSDQNAARAAVQSARDLANGLNTASASVQKIRSDADARIAIGVDDLNGLLSQFEEVNTAVVRGTQAGRDISAELDRRDGLLKSISGYVGINTAQRSGNDLVLYTRDGTTLFETVPRNVTFERSNGFGANVEGNRIFIDGVPLNAGNGGNSSSTGTFQGLLQVRDEVAPTFQSQLDEIARSLVSAFSESDQSAVPTQPDRPGLFTGNGGVVPAGGVLVPGLAARISVNAAVDPSNGGDPALLRDGGINGAAYMTNTGGGTGFSVLLDSYVAGFDTPIDFDAAAQAGDSGSILSYASDSIGWLEQYRSDASSAAESKGALASRSQDALSNATGVSIDEEMSRLLDLEQSYKASTKMISTVDQMLDALLAAVR